MNKQRFTSVWDAIEDTPEQAANMKLRSVLMIALKDRITRDFGILNWPTSAVCFGPPS